MKEQLGKLITESNNPDTVTIDTCSTLEMVKMINNEDCKVAEAVKTELPMIARVIDLAAERLKNGGRMFYIGAGSSGRLGVLDASECAGTYGVPPQTVQVLLAGGYEKIADASAGDEDSYEAGEQEIAANQITKNDVLVGVAASGRTPYVLGAIQAANGLGALTVGICNNPETRLSEVAQYTIAVITGPEVVQGSTRMKAGTAQKLILNMLSTGIMIKIGKVYQNLLVDMVPCCEKTFDRAIRMIVQVTGVSYDKASQSFELCGKNLKAAIICIILQCAPEKAVDILQKSDGHISYALGTYKKV